MQSPSSKTSPNQLRLHVEDIWSAATGLDLPAWRPLCDAYCALTGYQLECTSESVPPRAESFGGLPELFGDHAGQIYRVKSDKPLAETKTDYGQQLGTALFRIFEELQATRQSLRHREAELATAIPVTSRGYDASDFNHRLQAVLRGTVESLHGTAAALYLLDDGTSELKLRAQWGLPSLRFLEPARPLRGALADLEALTGHAVVLNDPAMLRHWNVPETYPSAVCIPVSSPETLLGTLWFFADEARDYSSDETQLLEIIAGRLAVELERRVLLQEAHRSSEDRELAGQVLTWHQERALLTPPRVEGWQVAGTTVEAGRPRGDFHVWRVDEQAHLWLTSAAVAGDPVKSMLSSTLLQGAIQATLLHHDTAERSLQHLNEILWSSSTGHAGASMFCGMIDPPTGRLEYAVAGSTDAYILRPHGWEPIAVDGLPLGRDEAWEGTLCCQTIHPGDVLVVFSDRHLTRSEHPTDVDTTSVAETLLRHIHLSAKDLAAMANYLIGKECTDPWSRSILVVKRHEEPRQSP